jgi:eukaryotic-like serine/threonine-protein kinase
VCLERTGAFVDYKRLQSRCDRLKLSSSVGAATHRVMLCQSLAAAHLAQHSGVVPLDRAFFDSTTVVNGRYHVGPLIGRGGNAQVYRVYDRLLQRDIAGKFHMDRSADVAAEALAAEARALRLLDHPSVVAFVDFDSDGIPPCLLMDLVDGCSLEHLIAGKPWPPLLSLQLLKQLVTALAHIHSRGVLHLDLKPANIMLTPDGHLRVVDFGVGGHWLETTAHGDRATVLGTPSYMAPEQWAFERPCERTDLWAVGMLLHEMLCGSVPALGAPARLQSGCCTCPPVLTQALGLPKSVQTILDRTLVRDRRRRVSSADELGLLISCAIGHIVSLA